MKKIIPVFCAAAMASFSGCMFSIGGSSAKNGRPEWIEHWSNQYPGDAYLAGVGSGQSRPEAEDYARGEIAKVFSAQINVQESVSQTETDASGKGQAASSFSSQASMQVRTTSKKVLEGIVIAQEWQDPASKQYYALAVLDRQKAADGFSQQISALDQRIGTWRSDLTSAPNKLARAKDAARIVSALNERRGLSAELRVASPGGESVPSPVDQASARLDAEKALAALTVTVDISGENAGPARDGVIEGLKELGIGVSTGSQAADLAVSGEASSSPVDLGGQSAWKRAAGQADLRVRDESSGQTILALNPSVRADATDYSVAAARSRAALSAEVAAQLQKALSGYLAGTQ